MIEYKRFISYIYAYAGGVRDKNTGFAKAQVQGQKFELAINLRGVYTDTPEYMNVSFVMQKEENKSKYRLLIVGRILVNNGIGSYMGVFNAENIENSGFEFSDIGGIAITKENDTYYMMSSMWQDDEINENNIEFLPKGYNKNLQMKQAGDEAATPQTTEQSPLAEIEQVGDSVINTVEQQKIQIHSHSNLFGQQKQKILRYRKFLILKGLRNCLNRKTASMYLMMIIIMTA